jgi:hypothetical protein
LFPVLFNKGIKINFAHKTFEWSSEAKGKAAVHCVIIGFSYENSAKKYIFEYDNLQGDPHKIQALNINGYLVDAPNVSLPKRSKPLSPITPHIQYGSMPIDNGNLILSEDEAIKLVQEYPESNEFIRQYIGGEEFINNKKRFCLWLVNCNPNYLKKWPNILKKIKNNQKYRILSNRPQTKQLAKSPQLFGEIRQPNNNYLFIPKVSSQNRQYIPIGFCNPNIIASGSGLIIENATLFHFGILQSSIHAGWVRSTAGRMKSDYQYSAQIVYNNFPWPTSPTQKQIAL